MIHIFLSSHNFYQNQFLSKAEFVIQDGSQNMNLGLLISFVIHSLTFFVLIYKGYLSTVSDPTDKSIYYQRFYKNDF